MTALRPWLLGVLVAACLPPTVPADEVTGEPLGSSGGSGDLTSGTTSAAPTTGAASTTSASTTGTSTADATTGLSGETSMTADATTADATTGSSGEASTSEPAPEFPDCGFARVPLFVVDDTSVSPLAGDIDADGDDDIVTISFSNGMPSTLSLWRAEGADYVLEDSRGLGFNEEHFIAEVDGEPGLELVVLQTIDLDPGFEFEQRTEVFRWTGYDGPGFPPPVVMIDDAVSSPWVQVGDVDNDGLADLYIRGSGAVEIWHGVGDGSFVHDQTVVSPGCFISSATLADIDDDGRSDLVTVGDGDCGYEDPPLILHRGGPGGFGPPEQIGKAFGVAYQAKAGRFNADDKDDIVYHSDLGDRLFVAINDGVGGLAEPWEFPLKHPGGRVVDFDGDGLSDILRGFAVLRGTGSWFETCSLDVGGRSLIDLDAALPHELLGFDYDGSEVFALVAP